MDKTLQKIIKKYELFDIECALVQLFVEQNNIIVKNNILIKAAINNQSESIIIIKKELYHSYKLKEMPDLVNVFELLIPKDDKKINGAFFTPKLITDYIVSETIKNDSQKVCDPSCGCGAFLISAAKYISENFNKPIVQIIEENLFGVDIANYSIKRAKILLTLLALKNDEDKNEIQFNLKTKNSLYNDWNRIFDTKFDVIIGNPPYVKFQDLSHKSRMDLNKNWITLNIGNYNLYFAFFELGLKLMKQDGILAYITPNNYFTSLSGITLRKYLTSNNLIFKILDFNHLKLFEAQTYTCITFLKNNRNDFFHYERIDSYEALNKLSDLSYSKISFSNLNNRKWRLLRQEDQENIRNIESAGEKLGDIVDIRVGIATCKDSVYFIDTIASDNGYYFKTYGGKKYKIEHNSTKPIAKISDFKNQQEINNNTRRIIFPYQKINNKIEIIKEDEFRTNYPHCYKYLLAARIELENRDKGNVKYPTWYAYARTQGLNFFGEKLLTPTFSAKPRFLLEQDKDALFCNGYAIYAINKPNLFSNINQTLNLNILRKILNSSVMDYYIKRTSVSIDGGYPCYQKNFIELFGIPFFSEKEVRFLDTETSEEKINDFLINKYNLKIS